MTIWPTAGASNLLRAGQHKLISQGNSLENTLGICLDNSCETKVKALHILFSVTYSTFPLQYLSFPSIQIVLLTQIIFKIPVLFPTTPFLMLTFLCVCVLEYTLLTFKSTCTIFWCEVLSNGKKTQQLDIKCLILSSLVATTIPAIEGED